MSELKAIEGPYTCCETTMEHECIGFHITAPRYGSVFPLAEHERILSKSEGYTPEEIRATGHLLAASWDLLKALELVLHAVPDLFGRVPEHVELAVREAIKKAKGE